MNAFRAQAQERRETEAQERKYRARKEALIIQRRADRLALCQHQALMAKADRIWFAPRGNNGRSMNAALLRRHWSARGMQGKPMEVKA